MSEELARRMKEDRRLRNAALALVKADVAQLRTELSAKKLGSRVIDRVSEGAVDVFEEAVDVAGSNRAVLGTLIAAILVWFARNPIMELFSDDANTEPDPGESPEEPEGN